LFVLFGVPALGLSFGKINGRPVYNSFGFMIKYMSSPKILVFHKEVNYSANSSDQKQSVSTAAKTEETPVSLDETRVHLKQVQELLRKTASEESDIANKIQ
jgi:hypothetical protein